MTRTAAPGAGGSWAFELPDRWQVERFLGSGGQSEVWLAHDRLLGELVAVKVFHPGLGRDAMERLRQEVRLGRALRHPNLVRVYELIEAGGRLAMAMEWLPGGSVAQRLSAGPLPIEEALQIAEETLAALAHLHEQRIVHRDVKPSNLLLDESGHVRLADLGLVRALDDSAHLTRTATAVGTPAFMSPEQIRANPVSPATDLYALGVTLFHLITGQPPFSGASDLEVAHLHLQELPPDPRSLRAECPPWLSRFVRRLLEKLPRDRWPDATAALRALRRRRGLTSPRIWRRLAIFTTVLACTGGLAGWGVRSGWFAGEQVTASVHADGQTLRGLGRSGGTLWAHECASEIRQVERTDLDGDGQADTVVAAFPGFDDERRSQDRAKAQVLVIDSSGRLLSRFEPEERSRAAWLSSVPPILVVELKVLDLDGDGRPELIANCHHRSLGTAYLFVYWPALDVWDPILMHGGWIFHLQAIPGKVASRIRLLSTSAALAELPVAAELAYARPGGTGRVAGSTVRSGISSAGMLSGASLTWYTPLEQAGPGRFDPSRGLTIDQMGNSSFVMAGVPWKLDRWGNPSSSPNAGQDLAALRIDFLLRLDDFIRWRRGSGPSGVLRVRQAIERDFSSLLAEKPYRAIKGIYATRALADSGAMKAALEEIEQCWRDVPYDAVGLTLAQTQAAAGRLDDAAATLRKVASTAVTPAGSFHAPQLLVRVATEKHDPELLRDALEGQGAGRTSEALAVAAARARLWWDDVQEADASLHAFDTAPDGEAIACLARWRLGKVTPYDLDAMAATEQLNPDAALEARLATGAVLLGIGRAGEAVSGLEALLLLLRPEAGSSLRLRQLLDLAQALRARALLQAGRRADATAEAQRLAETLRPGLLPAILANEVLSDSAPR